MDWPTLGDAAMGTRVGEFYSRYGNPTVRSFEDAIAALEGAEDSLAFASGMGAVSSVVLALCSSGDHIVAQRNLYAGTLAFLQGPCQRFGIETTLVDGHVPGAFTQAVRPGRTMLVLAETPSNPRLDLVDLDELGALRGPDHRGRLHARDAAGTASAGSRRASVAALGHQGHRRAQRRHVRCHLGREGAAGRDLGVLGAARCRTVTVRLAERTSRHSHAGGAHHPSGRRRSVPGRIAVRAPGCGAGAPSQPVQPPAGRSGQAPDASRGTVLSIVLAGGLPAAERFLDKVQLLRVATSLGGPETLVCHPATTTHASLTADEAEAIGICDGMLRISVGLEDPADLLNDLFRALD